MNPCGGLRLSDKYFEYLDETKRIIGIKENLLEILNLDVYTKEEVGELLTQILQNTYSKEAVDKKLRSVRGETGATGARGYTPIKGIDYFDGKRGESGASPIIEEVENTDMSYVLKLTTDKGSIITPNLKAKTKIEITDTMESARTMNNIKAGTRLQTLGYYTINDGGGAEYEISTTKNEWSIDFRKGLYANILNTDYVNYAMFGAKLDGITDDNIPIRKAHSYGNKKKVLMKNSFGIIYKNDNEHIPITFDVDLSGSVLLIDNADCYSFYRLFNDDEKFYTYTSLIKKSELTKDASYFTMDNNSLPYNCVLHITDTNPWNQRNDAGMFYYNYRSELMYHNCYGYCTGNLIQGYDGEDTALKVMYSRYNSRRLTFKGCEVRLETTPNITLGTIQCYRHNVLITDFHVKAKPNSIFNVQYKGTFIEVRDAFNVEIRNIIGTNIAGDPTTRNGSGYTIRLLNTYQVVIQDCNINGFWGCTGMDCVKDTTIRDCTLNRIDVHDYFSNLTVDNCVVYDWGVNIGYGTGDVKISKTKFIMLKKPNMGGGTIININNTYGMLFDGNITIRDCEVLKDDKNISFIKVYYTPKLGTSFRARVKMPNFTIDNLTIRNKTVSKQPVNLFELSGGSDFKLVDRPDFININNLSSLNPNYTRGIIRMIEDGSSGMTYSDNITSVITVQNTIFCDDPVPVVIDSNGTYIDAYQSTGSEISFRTKTNLFNKCDMSIDNCRMVLYNDNENMNLYANNCVIYGFLELSSMKDYEKVTITNSSLRILGYNITYTKIIIPAGKYFNCNFKEYNYTIPKDETVYTTKSIAGTYSKLYNTNKDVQ